MVFWFRMDMVGVRWEDYCDVCKVDLVMILRIVCLNVDKLI